MAHREITLGVAGWTARVPDDRADDADWAAGCEALAASAAPHYNASVRALHARDVPGALRAAEAALRCFPYAPPLLDYALALALQHGDYDLAARVLATARTLGLDALVESYEPELKRRVRRWNEEVAEPDRLRQRYAANGTSVGYRDLLLLARTGGVKDDRTRADLQAFGLLPADAPSSSLLRDVEPPVRTDAAALSWRRAAVLGSAACLLGLGAGWLLPRKSADRAELPIPTAVDTQTPTVEPVTSPAPQLAAEYDVAVEALAAGDSRSALAFLVQPPDGSEDGPTSDAAVLAQTAAVHLTEQARPLWHRRDYAGVVERLRPLLAATVPPVPEGLYWLGVAAQETGDTPLALDAFRRFLTHPAAQALPHYHAQAAYSAATLAPEPEGRTYARVVVEDYTGTLYDNSTIRRLARHDVQR